MVSSWDHPLHSEAWRGPGGAADAFSSCVRYLSTLLLPPAITAAHGARGCVVLVTTSLQSLGRWSWR